MAVEKRIDVVIGGRKDGSLDSTINGVKASLGSMKGGAGGGTLGGLSAGGTQLLEGGLRLSAVSLAANGMTALMHVARATLELFKGNMDGVNDALQKLPLGLGQAFKVTEEFGVYLADLMSGTDKRLAAMDSGIAKTYARMGMAQDFGNAQKDFQQQRREVGLSPRDKIFSDLAKQIDKLQTQFDEAPAGEQTNPKNLADAIGSARALANAKVRQIDADADYSFLQKQKAEEEDRSKRLADKAEKEAEVRQKLGDSIRDAEMEMSYSLMNNAERQMAQLERKANTFRDLFNQAGQPTDSIDTWLEKSKAAAGAGPVRQAFLGSSVTMSGISGQSAADRVAAASEKTATMTEQTVGLLRELQNSMGTSNIYDSAKGV